jgi:hypothetical protein
MHIKGCLLIGTHFHTIAYHSKLCSWSHSANVT